MTNIEFAKHLVISYLSVHQTIENLADIYEISSSKDNKLLYKHIEALCNILTDAKKELERKMKQ